MNHVATNESYGVLTKPDTLTIQRVLPGPQGRVWDYLTKSDLRRQWLARGDMGSSPESDFELTWRNDELTSPPGTRPEGFGEEHKMTCRIIEIDPPNTLAFSWGKGSIVRFTLKQRGSDVLLTLEHSRLVDRGSLLNVSTGWHAHLDILVAKMTEQQPQPFWDTLNSLRPHYDAAIPA